jgi:predicted enzyme related to lactoylglutathione lyase
MAHVHHAIDYVEFNTPDLAASRQFLETAFGWTSTAYGPEYAGLHDGRTSGEEAGGLAQGEAAPPLVILYSADLAATERAVRDAGGEITVEPYDFPGGRRFHFREPGGAELAVWGAPDQSA